MIGPSQILLPDNTHNIHNRQASMQPTGFEPAIPANEPPYTHVLRPRGHRNQQVNISVWYNVQEEQCLARSQSSDFVSCSTAFYRCFPRKWLVKNLVNCPVLKLHIGTLISRYVFWFVLRRLQTYCHSERKVFQSELAEETQPVSYV